MQTFGDILDGLSIMIPTAITAACSCIVAAILYIWLPGWVFFVPIVPTLLVFGFFYWDFKRG